MTVLAAVRRATAAELGCASGDRPGAGVLDRADGLGQPRAEPFEGGARLGDVAERLFRRPQDRPLLGQRRLLALARVQPIQFGQAQGQFLGFLGRAGDDRPQLLGARPRAAPVGPGAGDAGAERAQRSIGVQQRPMLARVEQADGLVLAVHLQQDLAQLAQHGGAGRLVVDEGAAAAVGAKRPAQHQVLAAIVGDALVFQHVPDRVVGRWREHSRHRRLGSALAHQPCVSARADGQAQAVEDDRLARPSFTSQRRQPRADGQVQGLDEHDVADPKSDQHGCKIARNQPLRKTLKFALGSIFRHRGPGCAKATRGVGRVPPARSPRWPRSAGLPRPATARRLEPPRARRRRPAA